jgi:hypothetical protein
VRIVIVLMLLVMPSLVSADDTAPAGTSDDRVGSTRAAMHEYFAGEIRGGYVLVGMGAAGLLAGGLLYRQGSATARGASYPLLGIGVLHIAAGFFVNVSSARRVDAFDEQITKDQAGFVREESKRMEGVSTQFTVLKIAELVIATGGLTMAGIGWRTDRPRLKGAGLAIAAEMVLTLGFDVFAARRAHDYRDALAQVAVSSAIDPDTHVPTHVVVWTRSF